MIRGLVATLVVLFAVGAAPLPFDSQMVLQRYELEMAGLKAPKVMIFSYVVSQAGPTNIEQRHIIYRSGLHVRDETLSVDGVGLKRKLVRISQRVDRYALERIAPRVSTYDFLFLRTVHDGSHLDYEYETSPIIHGATGFVVDRIIIDGERYLPRIIVFHTVGALASATGKIEYGPVDGYWMPMSIAISGSVDGKPARERIAWGAYRFPSSLPASTFRSARPIAPVALPTF
ncbi:MAG: hypothetical protein ACYDGM_13670 [Vulcanimicrobiaceae bacterium]